MKGKRGKKGTHLIFAKTGLVKDGVWKRTLNNYPNDLIRTIRREAEGVIP
jgi:hypothetical protein